MQTVVVSPKNDVTIETIASDDLVGGPEVRQLALLLLLVTLNQGTMLRLKWVERVKQSLLLL